MSAPDPGSVLAALERYPALSFGSARVAVVGGFVRDVLLGREPRELDLVVEGDAIAFAASLGGTLTAHAPFGTATVLGPDWKVDLATARRERYPEPGALPLVEPAPIEEDLARRDFTVNALAVTVPDGALLSVDGALEDLASGTLRVLHERSFIDDPTRRLRLARYAERLGFAVDPQTARLAAETGFETLSGGRLGGELRLALAERDPAAVLCRVAGALPIDVDRGLIARALSLAPPEADRAMLVLGAVARGGDWLERLELSAGELAIVRACRAVRVPQDTRPSALWRAWRRAPIEAVALAGAREGSESARRWIEELRGVRLEIGGADLLAAGLPEGPRIGRVLERTLERKLDGELAGGREVELADALRSDP